MTQQPTAGNALDYRTAVERLARAQKPSAGAPLYSRWLNRPLGRRLAAMAYIAGRTPNQVTMISAAATFTGLLLVATVSPRWWLGPLVGGLLVLGYALDAADGQLARLRGGGSAAGEWLDHTVDAVKTSSFHLVVLISIWRFADAPSAAQLAVPIVFQVAATVFFFSFMLMDQLRRARGGDGRAAGGGDRLAQTVLAAPTDYGILCLLMVVVGLPDIFLPLYGLLCGAFLLVLLAALTKWWREVQSWQRVTA